MVSGEPQEGGIESALASRKVSCRRRHLNSATYLTFHNQPSIGRKDHGQCPSSLMGSWSWVWETRACSPA